MVRRIRFKEASCFWRVFFCIILITLPGANYARNKSTSLPFRTANNLIIIDARINGSDTLHFILDTGLKNSIICELSTDETIELEEVSEILVQGLGTGSPVEAFHSTGNVMEIGALKFPDCNFLVLSNNILQLSHKMGTKIHGMLSLKEFYEYVVEIDYENKFIHLTPPGSYENRKQDRFESLPMIMESEKPYVQINITSDKGISYPVKLLLDSGASNALWLDINSMDGFSLSEKTIQCYLGCGISGDVEGLVSRIPRVDIGGFVLKDVLVSFPDSMAIAQLEAVSGRNGSLGSEILKRFYVVLDFPGRRVLLSPNQSFSEKFHHDMSGIEIFARTPDQPVFLVSRVHEGSSAFEAGVSVGDQILRINNIPAAELTMDKIYQNLFGPHGKKIRMQILRENEKIKLSFPLKRLI